MQYIGTIGIFILLVLCTIEDIKVKKIITWHFLLIIPFFIVDLIMNTLIENRISWIERLIGLLIGGIFICLSKLTKGQIGLGDGYIIAISGLMLGGFRNIEMVTYSFLASSIISILLLSFFHFGKKRTIPFVPFLLLGFILSSFLGGSAL